MEAYINALVFALVVTARFGVPLAIPRFPLPAILIAMILDAVDQTIFQQFTTLDLDGYQSYDKALDVYYLAVAYISMFRNWTNLFAFEIGRFLWYYRLLGVALFELTAWRPLLLIFPNVFEYFFILYAAIRMRWDPNRLTSNFLLGATAVLWIGIKLPQEYWIHVAKLDTTDVIKTEILGVSASTDWGQAIAENLWFVPVIVGLTGLALLLARWIIRQLPEPDWRLAIDTKLDAVADVDKSSPVENQPLWWLIEKVVLVGLIAIIFQQSLPGLEASPLQLFFGISVVVIANASVSEWFAQRERHWGSTLTEFGVMSAVNLGIAVLAIILLPFLDGKISAGALLFVTLLLTLIVTLYDHYRLVHDQHVATSTSATIGELSLPWQLGRR